MSFGEIVGIMENPTLENKPLVEAIFEMRWRLSPFGVGASAEMERPKEDPYYRLLIGSFYERIKNKYPAYEQLPTAKVPETLMNYIVQHRFRVAENEWPLVQLGPGILTVNSTKDYKWESFFPRVIEAVAALEETYPKKEVFHPQSFTLRYLDAVSFDMETDNAYQFLRENLKLNFEMPSNLFLENHVKTEPKALQWHFAFQCHKPKGNFVLRIVNGMTNDKPALVWETMLESREQDIPSPESYKAWLSSAHELASHCFFKMIEGPLERRFTGE
jgi:uncharacterized protein (TIGR04255 family)